jgi:hypothetical protein
MGLFDAMLGRSKQRGPNLDDLFALPGAAVTLQLQAGLGPSGHAGVCWKPPSGEGTTDTVRQIEGLLGLDDPSKSGLRSVVDALGFTWLVIDAPGFDDQVARAHEITSTISDQGFGTQVLCCVFGLAQLEGKAPAGYLVYLSKRGSFYPFIPSGPQVRDNEEELRLRSLLSPDLPIEQDLSKWMALWGLPL